MAQLIFRKLLFQAQDSLLAMDLLRLTSAHSDGLVFRHNKADEVIFASTLMDDKLSGALAGLTNPRSLRADSHEFEPVKFVRFLDRQGFVHKVLRHCTRSQVTENKGSAYFFELTSRPSKEIEYDSVIDIALNTVRCPALRIRSDGFSALEQGDELLLSMLEKFWEFLGGRNREKNW